MKFETANFLEQARICIDRANSMSTLNLNEDTGRAAYLACFHAAQALIFEKSDKITKTHNGVHTEFARLTKDDKQFDPSVRAFLVQSYEYKSMADYFSGERTTISSEEARHAVEAARQFVAKIKILLCVS